METYEELVAEILARVTNRNPTNKVVAAELGELMQANLDYLENNFVKTGGGGGGARFGIEDITAAVNRSVEFNDNNFSLTGLKELSFIGPITVQLISDPVVGDGYTESGNYFFYKDGASNYEELAGYSVFANNNEEQIEGTEGNITLFISIDGNDFEDIVFTEQVFNIDGADRTYYVHSELTGELVLSGYYLPAPTPIVINMSLEKNYGLYGNDLISVDADGFLNKTRIDANDVFKYGSGEVVQDKTLGFRATAEGSGNFSNIFASFAGEIPSVGVSVQKGFSNSFIIYDENSYDPGWRVRDGFGNLGLYYDTDYNVNQLLNDRAITDVGGVKQLIFNLAGTPTLQEVLTAGSFGFITGTNIAFGSSSSGPGATSSGAGFGPTGCNIYYEPSGAPSSGVYINPIDGIQLNYEGIKRFDVKEQTLFREVVASYFDEENLRDQMEAPGAIPSTAFVTELIDAASFGNSNKAMFIVSQTGGGAPTFTTVFNYTGDTFSFSTVGTGEYRINAGIIGRQYILSARNKNGLTNMKSEPFFMEQGGFNQYDLTGTMVNDFIDGIIEVYYIPS